MIKNIIKFEFSKNWKCQNFIFKRGPERNLQFKTATRFNLDFLHLDGADNNSIKKQHKRKSVTL